jgi:hypothetical protein
MAVDADEVHGCLGIDVLGPTRKRGTELGDAGAEPPLGAGWVIACTSLAKASVSKHAGWSLLAQVAVGADKSHRRLPVDVHSLLGEGGTELGDAGAEPPLGVGWIIACTSLAKTAAGEDAAWSWLTRMSIDASKVHGCFTVNVHGALSKVSTQCDDNRAEVLLCLRWCAFLS